MADRGRDVSDALTEVRTVLSRAESAIIRLDYLKLCDGEERPYHPDGVYRVDSDADEMISRLQRVVELLYHWKKIGRPLRASGREG